MSPRPTPEEIRGREEQLHRLRELARRSMVRGGMIGAVIGAAAGYGAVRLWGAPLVPALVEGAAAGAVVVLLFVGPTWYAAYRTLAEGRLPPARRSAPRRPPDGVP